MKLTGPSGRVAPGRGIAGRRRVRIVDAVHQLGPVVAHAVAARETGQSRSTSSPAGRMRAVALPSSSLKPHGPVRRLEHHGHALVERPHGRVRGRCQDREGPQHGPVRVAPALPQPGQRERRAVRPGDRLGLLAVRSGLPLVEGVGGHEAASGGERAPDMPAVSDRALIGRRAAFSPPLWKCGTRPSAARPDAARRSRDDAGPPAPDRSARRSTTAGG